MKQSFILGGFLGFALSFASALLAGSDADTALRDAVFCALVTATLFRWLHVSMFSQMNAVLREREQAVPDEDTLAAAGNAAAGASSVPQTSAA